MATSMVAAVILMHRKGISRDRLLNKVDFLYREILARKGLIQINIAPTEKIITVSLQLLSDFVEIKNSIIQPITSQERASKSIMMLSYYRNGLVHHFLNEAEVMTALYQILGSGKKSASFDELVDRTLFIKDLMRGEFVLKDRMRTKEDVANVVKFMQERDFLTVDLFSGAISIDSSKEI